MLGTALLGKFRASKFLTACRVTDVVVKIEKVGPCLDVWPLCPQLHNFFIEENPRLHLSGCTLLNISRPLGNLPLAGFVPEFALIHSRMSLSHPPSASCPRNCWINPGKAKEALGERTRIPIRSIDAGPSGATFVEHREGMPVAPPILFRFPAQRRELFKTLKAPKA